MEIIAGTLTLVEQMLKYTFWTGVLITSTAAVIGYNSKPSNESFDAMVRKEFSGEMTDQVPSIVKNVAAYVAGATLDRDVYDYVVVKVGYLERPRQVYYIGVLGRWFRIIGSERSQI